MSKEQIPETQETLEIVLENLIHHIDKFNLPEEHKYLILGNVAIHYSKKDMIKFDKLGSDFNLVPEQLEDYNTLLTESEYYPESKSILLAKLGHQLIALSNEILLDKERLYDRNI